MQQTVSCRTCNSANAAHLFEKRGRKVVKCNDCGLIYLDYSPSETDLKGLYSEGYYFNGGYQDYIEEKPLIQINARHRIEAIKKMKPGGRLLEIGCALGFFLEEAKKSYESYGVEISDYGASYAREKLGLNVKTGTLEPGLFPKNYFDVVVMWDVIEHLNEPNVILSRIREVLKPDGLLVFTTMDVGSVYARLLGKAWHLYDIPEHLVYYDRKTVAAFLEKNGFRASRISNSGSLYGVGYILFRLSVMYKNFFWKSVKKISDVLRISDIVIPINLGDLMTVCAIPKREE